VEPSIGRTLRQDTVFDRLHVIAYRAILDVPRKQVRYVSRLLAAERGATGTRRETRASTCWYQALMVLVWFGKNEDKTQLGTGFGVSRATAYGTSPKGSR
jgi:hypothetical protein